MGYSFFSTFFGNTFFENTLQLGLVHMDIKPENILITNDGILKLGDLGMARPVQTNEDGLEGDARYMAPELLNGSIKTRQLDLFSFGVMVWELAAGRNPPKEGECS